MIQCFSDIPFHDAGCGVNWGMLTSKPLMPLPPPWLVAPLREFLSIVLVR